MSARQGLSAADSLRLRLSAALAADGSAFWGESGAMTRALEDVRRRHDDPAGDAVAAARIARAVAAFRDDGRIGGYVHLRHVCLGATSFFADDDCLLADATLRERLLLLAATVPGARRQMKAFQCLLRAYWAFPLHGEVSDEARGGFAALRDWLARRHAEFADAAARKSRWSVLLGDHANLLSAEPCARYGPALLRGDGAELQAVVDGLAIPAESWVKADAVLAQARAAATLGDGEWLQALPQLLDIAAGKAGVDVPASLARRCVSVYLARHARCETVEHHAGLLEAAVAVIGNPWQRRAAWDAHVLDAAAKPCELARAMVDGWLKHRLIGEFFRLHGADREGERRAAYWQRYDPFVVALWVGLTAGAMERRSGAHADFARHAVGCLLLVDGIGDDENVLMLRIGDFLVVEFAGGERGLHLFRWNRLDARLTRRLGSARDAKYFSLTGLMESEAEATLAHRDHEKTGPWEGRFDDHLRPLLWRGA